jgi:hypothetical protein
MHPPLFNPTSLFLSGAINEAMRFALTVWGNPWLEESMGNMLQLVAFNQRLAIICIYLTAVWIREQNRS